MVLNISEVKIIQMWLLNSFDYIVENKAAALKPFNALALINTQWGWNLHFNSLNLTRVSVWQDFLCDKTFYGTLRKVVGDAQNLRLV